MSGGRENGAHYRGWVLVERRDSCCATKDNVHYVKVCGLHPMDWARRRAAFVKAIDAIEGDEDHGGE